MERYRTWLQLGLITTASLTVFGCLTLGAQIPSPSTPPLPTQTPAPGTATAPSPPASPMPSPTPSLPPVDPTFLPEDAPKTTYGVRYVDLKEGTGASPQQGQTCVVHYTGWLKENGKKFESSLDRSQPYEFKFMTGSVIRGWDEGIATMKVGGKRKLEIPPNLAYGESGAAGVIPSNATLIFDIELLAIK